MPGQTDYHDNPSQVKRVEPLKETEDVMAEWFTESERPERPEKTMQEKGEIVPSGSEPAFRGLRELGEMRISLQDAEWLKRLANILWEKIR